jgi:glycine oxidase
MDDCLIIGGGVIGLSLAWELAQRGERVRVVDQGSPGQEASWAGAGILPPGQQAGARTPVEQLFGLSNELHAQWSRRLRELTGIDNGYRRCGGLYLPADAAEVETLAAAARAWHGWSVEAELLGATELAALEPALRAADDSGRLAALHLPAESQVRNPWHLKALLEACRLAGVTIESGVQVLGFERRGGRLLSAETSQGTRSGDRICITGGAWTPQLLEPLGVELPIVPIRGQIVLFQAPERLFTRVINVGKRYLVPREDGHVLVGSTEERAGFDKRNTDEAIADLIAFACALVPGLVEAKVERTWAGLRPATPDELPCLGPLPGYKNAWVAAGHFRAGLQLSTGTAVVMARQIRGEAPQIALDAFSPARFGDEDNSSRG